MQLDTTTTKLLVTLAIIVAGYLIVRFGSQLIFAIAKRKDVINIGNVRLVKLFRFLILIATILVSLAYLQVNFIKDTSLISSFLANTYSLLPTMLIVILLIVLAIAIVNLITFGLGRIFDISGITEFMLEQRKEYFLNGIIIFVRAILYLFTVLFLLSLFGLDVSGITSALGWLFYGIAALFFLYVFFGTRAMAENLIAGIYLRMSGSFKLGQKVKADGVDGSIKSISNQGVSIKSDSGYITFIPNREFVKKEISFKNIETDLDTLEKIKSYYVEQKPSYCGPACASMILRIFGYNEPHSK